MSERNLTREQVAAIRLAGETGRRIARDYPGIADDYRAGRTHNEILEEYGLSERYGVTKNVAIGAVRCALYGLIPENELRELETEHRLMSGQKVYEEGLGIHAQTHEEWVENRRRGGLSAGQKSYEEDLGIFSLTPDQLTEAGRKSALARGFTPWSDEEKSYILASRTDPEYSHKKGPNKGRPDYRRISSELKSRFGTERTPKTIQTMMKQLLSEAGEI